MNKVSIGFSRPKKWKPLAWLIMLIEGTNFSHTFVTRKCTNIGARKVFEAVGSGVRIISNNRFKEKAWVVEIYVFEVSDEVVHWLDRYSHEQAGKPYGFKHILGLALMRALKSINIKIANPFKDGKYSEVCVESGGQVVERGLGIDLPGDLEDYGLVEYHQFIKQYGEKAPPEKIARINGVGK